MISVYFYNITKRLNSTAVPSGSGTELECVYKESTSLLNPILKLQLSNKPDYNYFKIDNRYYWITDIISLRDDLWQISGRIDVLATYKGHISATTAFVLYDSTANTQLPDDRLAVQTDCTSYTATADMPFDYNLGTGTYFIATTGDKDQFDFNTGLTRHDLYNGTGVYTVSMADIENIGFNAGDVTTAMYTLWNRFTTILGNLWTELIQPGPTKPSFTSIDDIVEYLADVLDWLGKMQSINIKIYYHVLHDPIQMLFVLTQLLLGGGNALSNIKAAYWLPFTVPGSAVTPCGSKPLALGTFQDNLSSLARLKTSVIRSQKTVSIPWHFSDWRNAACTEVFLYIPLIGCISIPSNIVKGHNSLDIIFSINLYSGTLAVEVKCDGAQIGTYGSNCAMPFLIGDSNMNVASLVNTVTNAAAENYAGAIASGMGSLTNMATSVGGIGGGAGTGLTSDITCICRVHETSQEPSILINTIGTPTFQLKTLSGSGFCQCMNAQMNGTAVTGEPDPTQTELEQVNNYLNTGVYLE